MPDHSVCASTGPMLGVLLIATEASVELWYRPFGTCKKTLTLKHSHSHNIAARVALKRRCRPTHTQHIPALSRGAHVTRVMTQLGPSARTYRLKLVPKPHEASGASAVAQAAAEQK